MSNQQTEGRKDQGISKVKLALGAASLFLFIIGVKRTFQMDPAEEPSEPVEESKPRPGKKKKNKK